MNRRTTLRRYVVRDCVLRVCVQRIVVASVFAASLACGASRVPPTLRGYDILVPGQDSQSVELSKVMKSAGYKVRTVVKGGSHRTAALVHFLYADPGPDQPTWLHIRLADTRSGAVVGVASVQLDSTLTTPHARAVAAVAAITGP